MSTQALTIRRLTATSPLGGDALQAERVTGLLRSVAERRLAQALDSTELPAGTWCIRRLDVPVLLDLDQSDVVLAAGWAGVLVAAIQRALGRASPDVVRYDRDIDAVADLVCGLATGRTERAWAWMRLGLLNPLDPLTQAPRVAILAALQHRPEQALGVIRSVLHRIGLPPVHRVLGPTGWAALADLVTTTAGADVASSRPPPSPPRQPRPAGSPGDRRAGPAAEALAAQLVGCSSLAELVGRSRLRPDPPTMQAWALLVVAEADSAILRSRRAAGIVATVARILTDTDRALTRARAGGDAPATPLVPAGTDLPVGSGHTDTPATSPAPDASPPGPVDGQARAVPPPPRADVAAQGSGPPPGRSKTETGTARQATSAGAAAATGATVDIRQEPRGRTGHDTPTTADDEGRWHSTSWGGLLFLLATAAEAGIPDTVIDDPALATRPLPWVLHGVALHLGVPAAEPAVAAFAGGDPAEAPPWRTQWAPTAAEQDRLSEITHRWAAVTAAKLTGDDEESRDVVPRMLHRRGRISYVPGWIELELDLGEVDIAVRRAGLDLDPGWVPWLGTVVRYVYV